MSVKDVEKPAGLVAVCFVGTKQIRCQALIVWRCLMLRVQGPAEELAEERPVAAPEPPAPRQVEKLAQTCVFP